MSTDNVTSIAQREAVDREALADKLIVAKSIIQAVMIAADHMDETENFDQSWPLRHAVELLEEVAEKLTP